MIIYFVVATWQYYPNGGFDDIILITKDKDEAFRKKEKEDYDYDLIEIKEFNIETLEVK